MDRKKTSQAGLAALVVLAPGGFVLGAVLAARYWRARREKGREKGADASPHRP
ncbi:MAG: hypothetical protein M3R41_00490 [Pseudomonadota bacterium]|nr:hypothetical protein [Pseudomonadota bacterium]